MRSQAAAGGQKKEQGGRPASLRPLRSCAPSLASLGMAGKGPGRQRAPVSHKVIEKRRRDRINRCLSELGKTVPMALVKQSSGKLEKAEILEMTVQYLRALHAADCPRGPDKELLTEFAHYFHSGYHECMKNLVHYLTTVERPESKDTKRERQLEGPRAELTSPVHWDLGLRLRTVMSGPPFLTSSWLDALRFCARVGDSRASPSSTSASLAILGGQEFSRDTLGNVPPHPKASPWTGLKPPLDLSGRAQIAPLPGEGPKLPNDASSGDFGKANPLSQGTGSIPPPPPKTRTASHHRSRPRGFAP
ncbi:hairy and enhancer of split-related protein HELT [Tachyglossus aculeatus]|uniref:hairy and enhancer of split-related protein HELT n=1 Tax=Tachyglossus aculeatus TaxID=9261 RepID=UPI0018F3D0C7|nr:hairy and enhancer of split-related protein HELT [Tachyglossus aculeatus]